MKVCMHVCMCVKDKSKTDCKCNRLTVTVILTGSHQDLYNCTNISNTTVTLTL